MAKKRKTTEALVIELRDFHHFEAADRLRFLQAALDNCEVLVGDSSDD